MLRSARVGPARRKRVECRRRLAADAGTVQPVLGLTAPRRQRHSRAAKPTVTTAPSNDSAPRARHPGTTCWRTDVACSTGDGGGVQYGTSPITQDVLAHLILRIRTPAGTGGAGWSRRRCPHSGGCCGSWTGRRCPPRPAPVRREHQQPACGHPPAVPLRYAPGGAGFLLQPVPESVAGDQHRPGRVDALQLERIEQSGKELADLGEYGDQPLMERIHGTRYYG